MPVAVRVLRQLSTFRFGLRSAGGLCDFVAAGRAPPRAGLEVFNRERNEPSLSLVRCNQCATMHVAERFRWHVWFGTRDARQQMTRGPFQVLSWTSSVSVFQALECQASSVTGDI